MEKKGISIVSTGRHLPTKICTNFDMENMVDTSDEWIKTRTGIEQRYFCQDDTCVSLGYKAAKKALDKCKNIEDIKSQIGAVVVATSTSDYAFPSAACLIKEQLGLPEDVMAFDISAACSGFLYAIEIVRGLLLTGDKEYGLIIGSEQMSKITDFTDRHTCVLFGDGAGAALVKLGEARYAHNAWSKGDKQVLYCNGPGSDETFIHMEGNKVFRFAVSVIEKAINKVLDDEKITMDDIDYVVCHQANERIINHVSKKYKDNEYKFYKNISRVANTSAASIPIALDEMFEKNILKSGNKVICVGFGAGLTWSSVLLTV